MGGMIGISPYAVASYFDKKGYRTILASDNDEVDVLSRTADASILYEIYNDSYTLLGVNINTVGHHFVEYHKISDTMYGFLNVSSKVGYRSFQYPSDYARIRVAILIYK